MEVSSFDLPNLWRVLREGCGGGTGALSQTTWSIVGPVNLHLVLLYVAQGEKINEGFYILLLPAHPTPKGETYFLSYLFYKEESRSQPLLKPLCSLSGKQGKVANTSLLQVQCFVLLQEEGNGSQGNICHFFFEGQEQTLWYVPTFILKKWKKSSLHSSSHV